jgi:hypothetical protein
LGGQVFWVLGVLVVRGNVDKGNFWRDFVVSFLTVYELMIPELGRGGFG